MKQQQQQQQRLKLILLLTILFIGNSMSDIQMKASTESLTNVENEATVSQSELAQLSDSNVKSSQVTYSCIFRCGMPASSSKENYCAASLVTIALTGYNDLSNPDAAKNVCKDKNSKEFITARDFCKYTRKKCSDPDTDSIIVSSNN